MPDPQPLILDFEKLLVIMAEYLKTKQLPKIVGSFSVTVHEFGTDVPPAPGPQAAITEFFAPFGEDLVDRIEPGEMDQTIPIMFVPAARALADPATRPLQVARLGMMNVAHFIMNEMSRPEADDLVRILENMVCDWGKHITEAFPGPAVIGGLSAPPLTEQQIRVVSALHSEFMGTPVIDPGDMGI